ncbi:unnamed protein product [Closterium sp. Naga37s-1]|nr:unnamed protein product [Closterium sp. Naga37s-1]
MVFYFKVRPEAGDFTIYMGLDKFENEQLIKYGFPEDIWFHVDKLSSAHVYLRLRKGQGIDDVTPEMLEDCAQLVKANSIMGNKLNNIDVVYTPWANLRKAASMDVGQIGFHNPKAVRSVRVEKRLNEVVNRLNKTKVEKTPDLQAEKEAREAEDRAARKAVLREQRVWARRESLGGMVLAASCCVLALNLSAQRRALGEAQRALAEALTESHLQADLLEAERRSAEAARRAEAEIRGELRRLRAEMRREVGKAGWGLAERIRALAGQEEEEGQAGEQGEGERAGEGEDGEERREEEERGDGKVTAAVNEGQQQQQQQHAEAGLSGREGEGGIAGSEPSAGGMSRAVLISARGGGSGGAFGANRIVVLFTVSLLLVASAAASFFAFCPASSRSIDETKQHQRHLQQEQQEGVVGNFNASQPSQQGQQQVNGASEGTRGEAGDGSGGGAAGGAAARPGDQEEMDENQPPETSGKCPPSETIVKHSLWHASGRYFHSMGVFPLCSMDACFSYSRCPADPSKEPLVYSYWPGQHYFKRFNETRWHTDDPAKACFFFVHMARGQPNEFTDLEHWGENGANHVLISFSDSWSGPSPFGVSSAMVMVTNAQATLMRTDFDTSIPLPQMWKNPPVELRNLPAGSARKYFLTFRGTRYLGNLKGNFRSAPEFKALHNGKDVVVLTRCGGSTNARILAEEPSLKPECDEDAKLYTQYDFADVMNTTFTLAPAGRQGSTYRFLEALTVGAIPVVVADNWRLPFDDIISWHHCLLRFPTDQMHRILPTLRAMDEVCDDGPKAAVTAADGAAKSPLRADDDTWKQRASTDKDHADLSGGSDGDAADGAGLAAGSAAAGAAGTAGGGEAGAGDGYEEEMTGLVLRNEEFEDGNTGGSGSGGVRCLHEVAYPKGWKLPTSKEAARKPLPEKPAKEYPFKLDPFQEEAVRCLEANESVLVSAHTSAGKTVVAEYAIAMAMRDNQRVVYTSPIKALSNQKFREMSQEFGDVGLMTGDVTIAPNATCLVMTTEILRSMLYRGSDFVREVGWIIFDEVHYLRDKERGVVWEESIVMAPKSSRFVFLSATVPNAREFAEWVAKVHQQPCHIVYTDYRPTPLQHYIFPAGGMGLFLAVDEKGKFREASFQKAMNAVEGGEGGGKGEDGEDGEDGGKKGGKWGKGKRGAGGGGPGGAGGGGGGKKGEESDIYKIVKMIMQRQYDPVIVFSFSRADCEALALQMSRMDLNDDDEKTLIDGIFRNAIDSLAEEDKKLPQVGGYLRACLKGREQHAAAAAEGHWHLPLGAAAAFDSP